jgi:hypothetical protein
MRIHVELPPLVSALVTVVMLLPAFASTVSADEAIVERTGSHVLVSADNPRPLHAVAAAIAREFGWSISVEDPLWVFDGDLRDASLTEPRLKRGVMVPLGGHLQVEFKVTDPERDAAAVMMALLEAANQQLPFVYRLDKDGENYRLVPVRARDAQGQLADAVPLLDRLVTIPLGTRPIHEVAYRMSAELSRQTGLQVSCCTAPSTGIPWGMTRITYGAESLRARDVLKYLTEQEPRGPVSWMLRCDRQFCFVGFR